MTDKGPIRILYSGSEAQKKEEDYRHHHVWDP